MPVYVLHARMVFTTAQRRNRVQTRATNLATQYGFLPYTGFPGMPAGAVAYTHTATVTAEDMIAGQSYPALTIAYYHPTDQQIVSEAEQLIQEEATSQGWLWASYGTGTDRSMDPAPFRTVKPTK